MHSGSAYRDLRTVPDGTARPGLCRLFKQYSDNESFRKWLSEAIFAATYEEPMKESA